MDDILYDPFVPHPFTYQDKSEWGEALDDANYRRKSSGWEVADLMLWGIDHFCSGKDDISNLYDETAEQLEMSRKTLQNYASCARKFAPQRRHPGLEIGHHIACLGMDEEQADHWLALAYANGWSVGMLRREAHVPDPEEAPVVWSQVESALGRNGVHATLRSRRGELQLPSRITVVVEAESNLKWSIVP